jgi:hypothetical protein
MGQDFGRRQAPGDWIDVGHGYESADDLLRDLDGRRGAEARAFATGYWMAIHEAGEVCLSGPELLEHLRADAGSPRELTGLGYVMAVRDGTPRMGRATESARPRDAARQVRAWLERRPAGAIEPALAAVQMALAGMPARTRPAGVVGWIGAQSALAKATTALAAALAVIVVTQHVAVGNAAARRADRDLAVSRQAEYMTTMLLEQRRYEKDSIINLADPAESESYARRWDRARMAALGSVDALGALDLTSEDRASLGVIRTDLQQYTRGYQELMAQIRSGQVRTPEEANRLLESAKPAAHRAEANGMLLATRALGRLRMR